MKLIDADKLSADMYHEAFAKDSDMQKWDNGCWIRYKMFEDVLKAQPAVQPDTTTNDSIPAKTSKNDGDKTSGDCISRTQAIMAIEQHRIAVLEGHKWDEGIEYGYAAAHRHLVDIIEQLPSAQPEHKTGRWIYGESEVGNDGYYCSECGNFVPWIYEESAMNFIREYKFCPNCGAKMDGERKE